MKVAAYQAPLLQTGSIEAAVALIAEQVRICATEGARILCCPEAVLGGLADYSIRPHDLAIDVQSGRLEKLLAPIASDTVTTIVGFTEAGVNGTLFNAAAVFSKGDVIGVYRKHHPAIRRSVYTPGDDAQVFEIDDGTFGIVICFDSTYPDLVRSTVQRGALMLFVPTNNGMPPPKGGVEVVAEARQTDVGIARQHGVAVVRADVAGDANGLVSFGSSAIVAADGAVIRSARQLEADLLIADLPAQVT